MKFVLAMHIDYDALARMTPDDARAFDEGEGAFNAALRTSGAWVSGAGFDEPARTIRFNHGHVMLTDGPFGSTPERLAGYWIIEAPTFDAAVEWGRKAPLLSGAIEVRPVVGD